MDEIGEAVNEMKSGKAPGLDGFMVECLKKGGIYGSVGTDSYSVKLKF